MNAHDCIGNPEASLHDLQAHNPAKNLVPLDRIHHLTSWLFSGLPEQYGTNKSGQGDESFTDSSLGGVT